MQKFKHLLFTFSWLGYQLLTGTVAAQTQKTLKETLGDLKKSFHPDKAFILPFSDSTNEDLQAFLFSVQQTKGVNNAALKMKEGKAVITVDTKNSMVTVWNSLEKEFRNRYTVTDRTPFGFVLADSYQNEMVKSNTSNNTTKNAPKQNTVNIYTQAERDALKDYQNPDTTKNKSIWQQQKDYAEQMRQKNKNMENEVYSQNNNLFYNNPKDYITEAPKEKGEWYVEYTLNGQKVTMYLANEKLLNRSAGKNVREIHCHFLTTKPYKAFDLSITDPAYYPDIRKFEFNKPTVYSKMFKAFYVTPNVPTAENAPVEFVFNLDFSEGNPSYDVYHVFAATGEYEKPEKDKISTIESGYFEVLYFESRENGILEARFAFTAKNVKYGWGSKKRDLVVTDGKLRIRLNNR